MLPKVNSVHNKSHPKLFLGKDSRSMVRRQLEDRKEHSPDLMDIRNKNEVLVFTYGTLMRGLWNHAYLRNAKFLGQARTVFDSYEMFDAGFPVLAETRPQEGSLVYGEVYAVDPDTLMGLDYLESNGSMYNRKEIPIKLFQQDLVEEDEKRFHPVHDCWTYFGNPEHWRGFGGLEGIIEAKVFSTQPIGISFSHHLKLKDQRKRA